MDKSFKARLAELEALELALDDDTPAYVVVWPDERGCVVSPSVKVYIATDEFNPEDA